MKTNQEKIKKINNLGKDFSNQKNWKNNKNNKWYHKNNKNNKWYHKNNKNNKWYHKNNKNNKWYHKNKQKNKKLQLESLFKKFEKYSAAVRKRKILKLTLLGRRAYYAFEEFNKRKKILVFRRPKNIFSVYTSLSLLDPYFYRATREYVAKQTVRRFGFFRWRRYFLRRLIKTRAAYFTHLKKSGGGRWAKKRKYVKYNYKSDLKIIKHQFSKWTSFLINNEIALRYSFFNNVKAPLLARIVYGPLLNLASKIVKLDILKYLQSFKMADYSVYIGFKFINNKNLSASIILQYLLSRLNLLYLPREIIPRLINRLIVSGKGRFLVHPRRNKYRRQSLVKGILFKCAGRFTRAQMASYKFFKAGRVPLNTIAVNVKYAFGTVSLKYGSLGLKVFVVV